MQKILITGASGFVGSRFVKRWDNSYILLTPSHSELDITDARSVDEYFLQDTPQVVVHLAAISNTGLCEQQPELSRKVNVDGAVNIASAASRYGAKMIFFSSDQVYNGNSESGPLDENATLSPVNVYGRDKLKAEEGVLAVAPNAVVLRATWMYDREREGMPTHANFVVNIVKATKERSQLVFPVREYRGITWVRDVVEYLPLTFSLPGGVYNYGAVATMNTYEVACCYCEMLVGLHAGPVIVPDYERYPEHERNLSMNIDKIFRSSGGTIYFGSTMDGLRIFTEMEECLR